MSKVLFWLGVRLIAIGCAMIKRGAEPYRGDQEKSPPSLVRFEAKLDGKPVSGVYSPETELFCLVNHAGDVFRWMDRNELSEIDLHGPAIVAVVPVEE